MQPCYSHIVPSSFPRSLSSICPVHVQYLSSTCPVYDWTYTEHITHIYWTYTGHERKVGLGYTMGMAKQIYATSDTAKVSRYCQRKAGSKESGSLIERESTTPLEAVAMEWCFIAALSCKYAHRESNPDLKNRNLPFYPLYYGRMVLIAPQN